jgi:hypothetical protein
MAPFDGFTIARRALGTDVELLPRSDLEIELDAPFALGPESGFEAAFAP